MSRLFKWQTGLSPRRSASFLSQRLKRCLPPRLSIILFLLAAMLVGTGHAQAADTVTYYYTDQQGTVLATADAGGNLQSTTVRRPYGEVAAGSSVGGPGFTGHVDDPDSALIYMQARYYDPKIGRMLSSDPVDPPAGDLVGFNRFAYVGNNPVGNTDPSGKQCAQCLYFPGDIDRQAQINQAASRMALGPSIGALPVVGTVQGIVIAFADPTPINIAAAVVGGLPEAGGAAAGALRGTSAAERAAAIAGSMSARTQRSVTVAVTETAEGVRVASSSEGALRPAARAALADGEVAVKGAAGTHAEINGINGSRELGLTPTGTAASRPICSGCAQALQQEGVAPLSPLKNPQN